MSTATAIGMSQAICPQCKTPIRDAHFRVVNGTRPKYFLYCRVCRCDRTLEEVLFVPPLIRAKL